MGITEGHVPSLLVLHINFLSSPPRERRDVRTRGSGDSRQLLTIDRILSREYQTDSTYQLFAP